MHRLCRAKFIVGSVKLLMEKEGGGAAWLQGLRRVPYLEASEALCSLPGVGPKVGTMPWPCLLSPRNTQTCKGHAEGCREMGSCRI